MVCITVWSAIEIIASLAYFDYAMVVSTAFAGSYFVVRALSLLFGGYPNEFAIYQSIVNGKLY